MERQASRIVMDSGTVTGFPSILTSTCFGAGRLGAAGGSLGLGGGVNQIGSEVLTISPCNDAAGAFQIGNFKFAKADSMALDAVWPRPQIDASLIACPISFNSASSSAFEPMIRPDLSRANSSSCRIVPIRQGTHCPHDSSLKNWA